MARKNIIWPILATLGWLPVILADLKWQGPLYARVMGLATWALVLWVIWMAWLRR